MMKIYNIDEYGSNLSADTYDPKSLIQDTNSFYENLGLFLYKFLFLYCLAKKQLEIYSGGSLNINTKSNNSNPNLTMNGKNLIEKFMYLFKFN